MNKSIFKSDDANFFKSGESEEDGDYYSEYYGDEISLYTYDDISSSRNTDSCCPIDESTEINDRRHDFKKEVFKSSRGTRSVDSCQASCLIQICSLRVLFNIRISVTVTLLVTF